MAGDPAPAPRPPEPGEFPDLFELVDGVFRSGGGSMARDYPRLLAEPNRFNLRVIVEDGRVVSHAGIAIRGASIEGMCVRVALMGAVATHPDSRGKGYATACVRSAMERAVECGADVMWISGGRGLYKRLGARAVGSDLEYEVTPNHVRRFARPELEVRELTEEHLLEAAELYAHEAVRFVRPFEDWRCALRIGFAFDGPSSFLGVWDAGRLAAYLVVRRPGRDGESLVVEYAGARGILLGALAAALERCGAAALRLHVGQHDRTLASRLRAGGLVGSTAPTSGTVLVLRFDSLMGRLRDRFLERAGEAAASQLSFAEEGPPLGAGNRFRIACGPDVIRIEGRGTLAEFLFGKPGCTPGDASVDNETCFRLWGASGPFRAALPAPGLWYGINFV
ncbi:MAG: GNAT family N-acetyltransferase [Planctomycetota bacterium]